MTRRQIVQTALKSNLNGIIHDQASAMQTGPVERESNRHLLWHGLLLSCLPHYSENDLLTIQRLLA